MKKKEKIIGAVVLLGLVMLIFVGVLQSRKPTNMSEDEIRKIFSEKGNDNIINDPNVVDLSEDKKTIEENNSESNKIIVEIKGEVNKPDVYELKNGSRINDLITIAGGITEQGILEDINRATILNDGDCIIVKNTSSKSSDNTLIVSEGVESKDSKKNEGKININTADKSALMTLTGIGEVKAESILSYREKNGKFTSVEQLAEVDGIGIKTVEKLKDKITIK